MVNNGLDDQPASLLATRTQGSGKCQTSYSRVVLMREHVGVSRIASFGFNCVRLPFSLVESSVYKGRQLEYWPWRV